MTAFGGALEDPTRVMGARIGAFILDWILVAVIVLAVVWLWKSDDYLQLDTSQPGMPTCAQINGPLGRAGETITPGTAGDPDRGPVSLTDATCIQVGSTAYVLTPDEVRSLNLTVNGLFLGFTFANSVLLQALGGATVGKSVFGLRVVDRTFTTAGIGRNLVRWLLMIIDAACCFLPGLISSNTSKGHRRIGDMAAGTYVVHRSAVRRAPSPGSPAGGAGPAPTAGAAGHEPTWDPARNAYVRFDPAQQVWFQWDDARQAWIPISG